ncbi:class I SAM-dependent methyltransferase [Bacillus sp. FJAT-42315]|uniref:class I SAM-dependent methyltransferase n=1 Tax=Bacillus sp. FJAT-42315 TaxID=2014077 RepID=UPI000C23AB30|nr:class I SAM-dependent methyltransferase [Bacillus sp. FJAT-42315]
MIISTASRVNTPLEQKAKQAAKELGFPYVARRKRSVADLQKQYESDCLIVKRERLELYPLHESEPFFFHPNSASFRVKRLMRGEEDPFVSAAKLESGMSVLDCTLGLASDSIVASFVTGPTGQVTGIEGNPVLGYIVKLGLKEWQAPLPELQAAMEKIEVQLGRYQQLLSTFADRSFDVVYFDPMFTETVEASEGIAGLRHFAIYDELEKETLEQAMRVAKQRVVLKDHFRSDRFERLGFEQHIRKTSAFHFGTIEVLC